MRNPVVSHEEWLKARLELLLAEKELTRQRDALSRRRMAMPWERVEKSYEFEGPNGIVSLADLFDGRSQLIVYHFMFAAGWNEGCKQCSFWADNLNCHCPSQSSRRNIYGRFTHFFCHDQDLQETHGVDLPMGFLQ
jgi:predicted dithiol-disulfide oxidoreductase (DUF899 family)